MIEAGHRAGTIRAGTIGRGFDDPIADAQANFRAVMAAMAEPGRRLPVPRLPEAPSGLPAQLAALALTLADFETPLWLSRDLSDDQDVLAYLKFFTSAPVVGDPDRANFALITDWSAAPSLDQFAQGTAEYPDRSTTLLCAVSSLDDGPELRFRGPGIRATTRIAPLPRPAGLRAQLAANRDRFPLGVDLVLATATELVALPRSARLIDER